VSEYCLTYELNDRVRGNTVREWALKVEDGDGNPVDLSGITDARATFRYQHPAGDVSLSFSLGDGLTLEDRDSVGFTDWLAFDPFVLDALAGYHYGEVCLFWPERETIAFPRLRVLQNREPFS